MLLKKFLIGSKAVFRLILKPSMSYFSVVEKVCLDQLKINPNDRYIRWFLSNHYAKYKKFDCAEVLLESLVEEGPVNRMVMLLLSRVYFNLEKYKKVVDVLYGYRELNEEDLHNYYLGYSFVHIKNFERAIEYLRRYVKHHQKDYVGFVRLGYAYYMIGEYKLSLEAYNNADSLNPGKEEIKESIDLCINMLKESGRSSQAIH